MLVLDPDFVYRLMEDAGHFTGAPLGERDRTRQLMQALSQEHEKILTLQREVVDAAVRLSTTLMNTRDLPDEVRQTGNVLIVALSLYTDQVDQSEQQLTRLGQDFIQGREVVGA